MMLREGCQILMSTRGETWFGSIEASCGSQSSLLPNYLEKGCSFFPPETWMLNLSQNHFLNGKLSTKEWFAMDWIPQEAVKRIIRA